MPGGEREGSGVCQQDCVCTLRIACRVVGSQCVCPSACTNATSPMTEARFTLPVPCSRPGTGNVSWGGCEGSTCVRNANLGNTIPPTLSLCHHPPPAQPVKCKNHSQDPSTKGPKPHQTRGAESSLTVSYVTLKPLAAGAGRQKTVGPGRVWIDARDSHICAQQHALARWEQGLNVSVFPEAFAASQSSLKLMSLGSVTVSNRLILCRPFSFSLRCKMLSVVNIL